MIALPDPFHVERPGIWYPQGAGGMWLNYLIWCSEHEKIIPGDHPHFEWPYIQSLEPEYVSYLDFYIHGRDHTTAPIILGNNNAWLNFFLNINAKKGMPNDYNSLIIGAKNLLKVHKTHVEFNLDWCLIFTNPEQFVQQLNKLVDYEFEVEYNSITEQAFEQYRRSCIKLTDHADPQIRAWRTAILELFTDKAQSLPQRLQIAEEIFYNTYYEI